MNAEIKKSLEMRQENLIFLLKNKKEDLELEKQHQIYGAIKEIDYILRMLKATEEQEEVEELSTVEGNTAMPRPVAIKVEEKQKNFRVPIRIKFQKDR